MSAKRLLRSGAATVLFKLTMFAASAQSPEEPPKLNPTSGFTEFSLTTEYQAGPSLVQMLLPDRLDPSKRYPVLYILPVESGTKAEFGSGMAEAKKADIANKYGVICVCPTFNKAAPWYGNHATNPALRQEDYMVRALVPFIDAHFPTRADKEGRWLIGFSKSAWGAYTLLFRHPEIFGYAAGWDAPFMIDGSAEDWGPMGLSANFGTKDAMLKNLPTKLAAENASWLKLRPRLVLGLGIFWAGQTKAIHAHLETLGIPHVYRPDVAFPHRWDTGWFPPLVEELARVAEASGREAADGPPNIQKR
jgi:S-formylglutathione hydrolase FrmB